MTARQMARFAVILLTGLVLVAAGAYVLVYLYRWEWNRAIVSGLLFVAALVTLSTVLILGSLRRLEDRLARVERARPHPGDVVAQENDRRAARHFDWLREQPRNLQVFIPVLLGAGVLLSFIAYAVERVAGMIAGPTVDRRTARLLTPDLPLGAGSDGSRSAGVSTAGSAWWPRLRLVAVIVVAAIAIGLGVDAIGDATQSRPEIPALPGTTIIELDISQRGEVRPPADVAATLWVACRSRVPSRVALLSTLTTSADSARLTLDHRLGDLHRRRLAGCLGDLTVTSVLAEVEAMEMYEPGE